MESLAFKKYRDYSYSMLRFLRKTFFLKLTFILIVLFTRVCVLNSKKSYQNDDSLYYVKQKLLKFKSNRAHAAELGNPVPTKPILFLKPTSSYIKEGQNIVIPQGCSSLHHEVELGIVIGKNGSQISEKDAMNHIAGYVLALDMTARDFQDEAKKKGQPWSLAKGFDTSCPVSEFIAKDKLQNPEDLRLWLKVGGIMKQDGNTKDMIFSIPYLISYISRYFTLEEGDVILTGTPEGVGPVMSGEVIEAGLGDLVSFKFTVQQSS